MPKRIYSDKLHIDMPFNEALERFAGSDTGEIDANIKRARAWHEKVGRQWLRHLLASD